MKKYVLMFVVALAALVSCKKETISEPISYEVSVTDELFDHYAGICGAEFKECVLTVNYRYRDNMYNGGSKNYDYKKGDVVSGATSSGVDAISVHLDFKSNSGHIGVYCAASKEDRLVGEYRIYPDESGKIVYTANSENSGDYVPSK